MRTDVDRLQASTLVPGRVSVYGHVYDVEFGLVTTVVPADGAKPVRMERGGDCRTCVRR